VPANVTVFDLVLPILFCWKPNFRPTFALTRGSRAAPYKVSHPPEMQSLLSLALTIPHIHAHIQASLNGDHPVLAAALELEACAAEVGEFFITNRHFRDILLPPQGFR